jgi:large subunit ribosomal protein L23
MGIFDKFKKKPADKKAVVEKKKEEKSAKGGSAFDGKDSQDKAKIKPVSQDKKKVVKSEVKDGKTKGKTQQAYRVLIKPLITEKASALAALNKYVFAVDPAMNKIEVKKAIRAVYNVDPIKVNISNFSGKQVRYGRIRGKTKSWKKAIVTLKAGDKIEVYEGV